MTFEFRVLGTGSFLCFLLLVTQRTESSVISNEGTQSIPANETLKSNTFGIRCGDRICLYNQICNSEFICQCGEGFKNISNECLPRAGENEFCVTDNDCEGRLLCIQGICRRPIPNSEFVSLAKIFLLISLTVIIVAIFGHVIKCLVGYNNFRRFQHANSTDNVNRSYTQGTQFSSCQPTPYVPENDKPPSYEECVVSTPERVSSPPRGPPYLEPPPPYVISSNVLSTTGDNGRVLPTGNKQNFARTPLSTVVIKPSS